METTERMAPEATQPRQRRVGTFTLGIVLVLAGLWMLASWFFPLDSLWTLKAVPLILIALGVETLLAARKNSRIKYDWAGMLLTFLLVCGAAGMYAAVWFMDTLPDYQQRYSGSMGVTEEGLFWEYDLLNGSKMLLADLSAGDALQVEILRDEGSISVEIIDDADREPIYQGDALATGTYPVEVPQDGSYEVWVTGYQASGSVHIRQAQENSAAE